MKMLLMGALMAAAFTAHAQDHSAQLEAFKESLNTVRLLEKACTMPQYPKYATDDCALARSAVAARAKMPGPKVGDKMVDVLYGTSWGTPDSMQYAETVEGVMVFFRYEGKGVITLDGSHVQKIEVF